MKKKTLLLTIAFFPIVLSLSAQEKGTFTDSRDGKTYKTVKIGTQTWTAENLAFKSNNGCWAYDDEVANAAIYGYLYNWETAKAACPKGWHLPSVEEWTILVNYLGGDSIAGGKLKAIGTTYWTAPNAGASNQSVFSALPGVLIILLLAVIFLFRSTQIGGREPNSPNSVQIWHINLV